MALIDDFIGAPRGSVRARGFGAEVFHNIGLSVSALAAGWRAAEDYERLSGTRSFSQEELPREVYRRHFDRLAAARKRV